MQRPSIQTLCDPPGGLYLCQVSDTVSCGACCGLFNVDNPMGRRLGEMLAGRTAVFEKIPRTIEALDDFAEKISRRRPGPVFDLHHCPFLGLVGKKPGRVGCLLHPLAPGNNQTDFRGLSHYGSLACRVYFCPSHRLLPPRYKQALTAWVTDWRLFSALVPEHRLVSAFFTLLERRLDGPVSPDLAPAGSKAAAAVERLLALKLSWPYVADPAAWVPDPFQNDGDKRKPPEFFGLKIDPVAKAALTELCSVFTDKNQARSALEILDAAVSKAAGAWA